jgi:hypothetical protein
MSIWDDVRIDPCQAELLVHQLVATARSLAEAAATLRTDEPIVTEDWSGAYRDRFDDVAAALLTTIGGTVATCEGAAVLVRARADEAAAEQRRRLQARDEFVGPVLRPG